MPTVENATSGGEELEGCVRCEKCKRIWDRASMNWGKVRGRTLVVCDECLAAARARTSQGAELDWGK